MSADRYEQIRNKAAVAERPLLRVERAMPELELQARWFAGEFGRDFVTTAGQRVRVVQFGVWNREAGPDFSEAAISIDDAPAIRGALEIDPDVRDWERHGHGSDPNYDAVILHVFLTRPAGDCFSRTSAHRNVPQVQLDLSRLDNDPPNPSPLAKPGRCTAPLQNLPPERIDDLLKCAAQFRLRKKGSQLTRLIELHGRDEALYQALATTLGYKSNKLPFTLLAQRLPLAHLRGNAEPLLFGVAGFLDAPDLRAFDAGTRGYVRTLWDAWWPVRAQHERLRFDKKRWRFSGLRPANHPQRRVAALAKLVENWKAVRPILNSCEVHAIRRFFATIESDYWDFHYTLTSARSARRMALIGESRVSDMLANVFFPLAESSGTTSWESYENLRAPLSNRRAETAATRLFGSNPARQSFLKSVAHQQALLQIYEDFCLQDESDCVHCPFPEQAQQW